jgi:Sigma-70, region 4
MKRGKIGYGAPERVGPDQVNAALVRLLIADALAHLSAENRAVVRRAYYLGWTTTQIADDLRIEECTVKSRLHFALRALRLILQRRLTRCTIGASGRQRVRDGVVPSLQALVAGACDGDRQSAGRRSLGASDIRER